MDTWFRRVEPPARAQKWLVCWPLTPARSAGELLAQKVEAGGVAEGAGEALGHLAAVGEAGLDLLREQLAG
jgi:hypothetical protein